MKLTLKLTSAHTVINFPHEMKFTKMKLKKLIHYLNMQNINAVFIHIKNILNLDSVYYDGTNTIYYHFNCFLPQINGQLINYFSDGNIYDFESKEEIKLTYIEIELFDDKNEYFSSINPNNPLIIEIEHD